MDKTNRLVAMIAVLMMVAVGSTVYIVMDSENSDAASYSYTLSNIPGYVELRPGDTLTITYLSANIYEPSDFVNIRNTVPWLSYSRTGATPTYTHRLSGQAEFGTWIYHTSKTVTLDVFVNVNFVLDGFTSTQKSYGTVQLPSPEIRPNYTLKWYTAQSGGSFIGDAGQTVNMTSAQTLYGRWEQTTAFFTPSTDDVYVHYLDSMSYTVNVSPPNGTIAANWVNPAVQQAFSINNTTKTISISSVTLISGTYELSITATSSGMNSSVMSLFIHVYPHEIRNLEPYGLSAWSYTVTTNNTADTMSLISASMTTGSTTTVIPNSSISIDNINRVIGYTFASVGTYEFALKITGPTGNNNTLVLRIFVTDTIISGTPSIDNITVIKNGNGNFDFVLVNPQNYASILWDFGAGTSVMNQNITQNYTYNNPGIYYLNVTLTNSLGVTATITKIIDAMQPGTPTVAYRNSMYVAVVEVAATNSSQVTVTCPAWMSWEFITAGSVNYVKVSGMFTDLASVGNTYNLSIRSNGNTDESWALTLYPASTDALNPDFEFEWINGFSIRLKYTGTTDGATKVYVQWITGGGYAPYLVTSDGWMYHTYTQSGTFTITISALRLGIEKSVQKLITINSGSPGGGDGGGEIGGGGPPDIEPNIMPIIMAAFVAVLVILGISAYFGQQIIAGISVIALLAIIAVGLIL